MYYNFIHTVQYVFSKVALEDKKNKSFNVYLTNSTMHGLKYIGDSSRPLIERKVLLNGDE